MIMKIRTLIRKFIFKYFERFTGPYFFSEILRDEGFKIGKGTIFYAPKTMNIDRERPWMLTIGDYCKITSGVTILTHDYSRSVLRRKYGEFVGEAGVTEIGDNVFIGMNSIILMGAHIGSNSIIGAGRVVKGTYPDDVVIAGNPAKVVCSLDEYYRKRKSKMLEEAMVYVTSYKSRYGRYPNSDSCGPFFSLYEDRESFNYELDSRLWVNGDNHEDIVRDFKRTTPLFKDYTHFLRYIESNFTK